MSLRPNPPSARTSPGQEHAPTNPSGLRQSHNASSYSSLSDAAKAIAASTAPDEIGALEVPVAVDYQVRRRRDSPPQSPTSTSPRPDLAYDAIPALSLAGPSINTRSPHAPPTETTALLGPLDVGERVHEGPCNHGTFSPRPTSPTNSLFAGSHTHSDAESDAPMPGVDGVLSASSAKRAKSWKKQWALRIKSKKMSTSSALAQQHGFKDSALMLVPPSP
jgi:hypothetical protein